MTPRTCLIGLAAAVLLAAVPVHAQTRGGRGAAGPPPTARASAPIDLTGSWVSVITEDWRYRMVLPMKGDYQGVPLTPEARKIADAWDPAKEPAADQCKAYGAPSILRRPGRLHFTWQDDTTLKMEADAGRQTRLFHFGAWKAPAGPKTLQGNSVAEWEGGGRGSTDGSMKVTTTNLKAGYLRKNGVPYSANTVFTEYWDVNTEENGDKYLVVTNVVSDPTYLQAPWMTAIHFKKEADGSKFDPTPCDARF